tara:strand:+ start:5373 stop:5771 length:399 start_codon:yes stop_codon:yes gene_type:complete
MKKYEFNNDLYCIVYRDEDWVKGLNFITSEDCFVQAGSWWYDKGKILDSHTHNEFERKAYRTQETVFVKQGKMKVSLFTESHEYLDEYILNQGDLAVFIYGGHGYEILEDDTKIIETKNGPFTGVENDKVKF